MKSLLVNIDVDDLERGVDFYTQAFELRVGRRLGTKVVELLGLESPLYVLETPPGSPAYHGAEPSRSFARHWTPVHLDFVVDDLEAGLARAEAAGARREGEIRSHDWGRIVRMHDPFGHGLCLIEFSALGYDAVAT